MERQIISHTSKGYGTHRKLNADYEIGLVTDFEKGTQFELSDEQKNVVNTILQSRNDIQAIQGKAGTGKTTTLATIIDGIEQGGGSAVVLAPTADAAYTTLVKDGNSYHSEAMQNAHTLARYFVDEKLWKGTKGSTLIVDEAGLMSVDDMHSLFALADQNNNRIVLIGDTSQHNSVMRGDAFRILQSEAGLKPVSLEEIRRQSGDYKQAVKTISEGKLVEGFDKLDDMGKVHVETDDETRYKTLANKFTDVFQQQGKTALTVAPTNAEGSLVNDAIREELKARKLIQPEEKSVTRFQNTYLTKAERGDSFNYDEGQMIRFQRNAKGDHGRIYKSSEFTVSRIDKKDVWIKDESGQEQRLDLTQAEKFEVYDERELKLSKGDHIRITEGHKSKEGKRLNNGAIYEVKDIKENGDIALTNDWVVDSSKGNFDHGYVRTSISSQGKTIDHIFLAQGSDYAGAASTEQFYVSVSRGKQSVELFTDDKHEIRSQIQRSHQRMSATELLKQQSSSIQEGMDAEDSFISMVGLYARNLYENMKENTQNWLSAFGNKPEAPKPESSKWRDLVSQQRDEKEKDISL
jgi:ATP-dependent exoDNAse (exonuclease V) alpha subunit